MTSAAPPTAFILMSCLVLGPACSEAPAREGTYVDGHSPDVLIAHGEAAVPLAADAYGAIVPEDAGSDERDSPPGLHDAATDGEPRDATADVGGDLQPIRIIRGSPTQGTWFDLTFVASGLGAYEGAIVNARIGRPDRPERLGSGQTRIVGGAFEMVFPDVLEPNLYKAKYLFIDVNGNAQCYPGEPVYGNFQFVVADLILTIIHPREFMPTDSKNCSAFAGAWPER